MFRDGSKVAEGKRQKIGNSQTGTEVEAEITSGELQPNKEYWATLVYETHFFSLEAEIKFSKC